MNAATGSDHTGPTAGSRLRGAGLAASLALLVAMAFASTAQAQAPVGLGTADSFGVLGGSTVTNTGPTVINGDLGVSPGTAITGFPPGTVNGTTHADDAVAAQAQSDTTTAYNDAAGRACNTVLTGQDLGGMTLTSGVYCFSSSAQLTGTLTLDGQGNPNSVFIFQIGSTLTTASGSSVNLINSAQSCNVFWQVGSSATLGTTTTFRGNVIALTSITANTDADVLDGRLLARNGAVTLDTNTVTRATCAAGPGGEGGGGEGGGGEGGGGEGGGGEGGGGTGGGLGPGPPIVDITGAPGDGIPGNPFGPGNRCIAEDFRLKITARDESGIRSIKVFLDGKLIKRTGDRQLFVWIRAEDLQAARHTVRVAVRDGAGNRTVKRRSFRRCNAPVFPDFTG